MTTLSKRASGALLAALIAVAPAPAAKADDDKHDQELARRALLDGRIRSLAEITEMVKPVLPGAILAVELEIEKDRFIYEFDILDPSGRLKEVEVDAATGEILKIEDEDD